MNAGTRLDLDDASSGFEAEDDFVTPPSRPWEEESAVPSEIEPPPVAPASATIPDRLVLEEIPRPQRLPLSGAVTGHRQLPAISIHIFPLRADTSEAAARVISDRRLQRVSASIMAGGLAAAVNHYQNEPTPSLVIVESHEAPAAMNTLLGQLAEVCDPGTKVIVIGQENDIALYRDLIRQGVSEYLVPPIDPVVLLDSISNLYSDPSAPFIGRSIAFVGAKGGVGASTIAHNFAYSLTEMLQVSGVIVDFDLPFGTAGLDFNQDPLQGVADALSQPDRLDPVLLERMMVRCSERLALFAAPANLEDVYDIPADVFEEVADKIKTTASHVILDLPHVWSGWLRKVLLGADEVVLVATPDLASLRNAKNILDLIRAARPNDQPPHLALNMVGVPGRPEIPPEAFGEGAGAAPAMVLPFDPKLFGNASNNGQMIHHVQARSKTVETLDQFVQLIARRAPPPPPKRGLLGSLLNR